MITRAISRSSTAGSPTRPLVAAIFFDFVGPKDTNVNDVVAKGRLGLLREAICIVRDVRGKSQSQQEPCLSELGCP